MLPGRLVCMDPVVNIASSSSLAVSLFLCRGASLRFASQSGTMHASFCVVCFHRARRTMDLLGLRLPFSFSFSLFFLLFFFVLLLLRHTPPPPFSSNDLHCLLLLLAISYLLLPLSSSICLLFFLSFFISLVFSFLLDAPRLFSSSSNAASIAHSLTHPRVQ